MAPACSFHGVVAIQNAMPYILELKKRSWNMDRFVLVSVGRDDSVDRLDTARIRAHHF
ncbi:hypothetical protein BDR04DRAFT_1100024 [Suillus decipiens]|nr:hypothetical protein BDR04DRAFT_1100024 [Suillus decipiens]